MQFEIASLYHVYNRGNNKQTIFFRKENYPYFLDKVRKYIQPNADILAWCLMPNHFHFLIHANDYSVRLVKELPLKINALTEGFRLLLSSYTQGINKQEKRTGNLFQQKTQLKNISDGQRNYGHTAFHYIHQNPIQAGLTEKLEDWEYSSYREYAGSGSTDLCNRTMAYSLFEFNDRDFDQAPKVELKKEDLKHIFTNQG